MKKERLNASQKAAVEAVGNPVLIFAGAGSGKTRVLTHKISHLVKEKIVSPENILAVTFTNKAANEMKERVRKLIKGKTSAISIGTFHSICARLLRNEIQKLGYTRDFVIYDIQDQNALLKTILDGLDIPKTDISPSGAGQNISLFKNRMIPIKKAKSQARTVLDKRLAEIYEAYEKALKKNNAVDFDDLLLLPLKLFEKHPVVLKKYREHWKYILVDEYQDTNRPQFLFVKKLAEKHKQICVVGDDDQSIYGWRGADIRNILDFEKAFPGCETYTLEKNYRSTGEILKAATTVVKNNLKRAEKELEAHNGEGEKLGLIETNDEGEEADAVVNALEKEIKINKRPFSNFAVLYRTNAQSRALEDSFRRNGIPYNIIGGVRFYERKEIKDIMAYLKLIVNRKDTVSLRRVINFPPRGIGSKTLDKCVAYAAKKKRDLFDVLNDPEGMEIRGKQADALKEFHAIVTKYAELLEKLSAGELVRALAEDTGVVRHYKESDMPEDRDRFENIMEFLSGVDEFMARNPDAIIQEFLEEVSLLTDIDQWNDEDNRVTLMTVHAAKGLEFPVVFLAGLEDGLFPLYQALEAVDQLEEERRLFYVGLTRAKDKVYLLYAKNRRRYGGESFYGMVSRFIHEIPEDSLEKINFSSAVTRKLVTKKGKVRMELKRTVTIFDDFRVGDTVEHAIFGIGKIMALSGSGENQRVGVVFKDGLKKKLIVRFANLKKVASPES